MSTPIPDPIDRTALRMAIEGATTEFPAKPWYPGDRRLTGLELLALIDAAPALLRDEAAPPEQRLNRALRENQCGDLECEERRIVAAVRVLTGGATHLQYAALVGDKPEPVPCPLCPHWMHLHEADGSCGGGCH